MSNDEKLHEAHALKRVLMIPVEQRSASDIDLICSLTRSFKFFREINEKEESTKLHQELSKIMSIKSYSTNDRVFQKGEQADSLYIVLTGKVHLFTSKSTNLDAQITESNQSSNTKTIAKDENSKSINNLQNEEFIELTTGESFGDLALLNDRPRYFTVICIEPTVLGVILKENYQLVARTQEKQSQEKIDFLRSLYAFKTWTRIAIQKLSLFFKTHSFKKSNIVYNEGDPAKDVFIVKAGEFVFTQNYKLDITDGQREASFGNLTKRNLSKNFRFKQLNLVIKCKGEIFGYNEIYENKKGRDFTCTCYSTYGELLVISDKNFAKKVSHPETLKFIEDQCEKLKPLVNKRISNLKETEKVKDLMSFTSINRIRQISKSKERIKPETAVKNYECRRYRGISPIDKFISHSQRKTPDCRNRLNYTEATLFTTEVSDRAEGNKIVVSKTYKGKNLRFIGLV